jgi:hypothetical protein
MHRVQGTPYIRTHRGQDDMALHRGISGISDGHHRPFQKMMMMFWGHERQNFVVETIAGPGRRLIKPCSF